jgi:hypothetical protein
MAVEKENENGELLFEILKSTLEEYGIEKRIFR